MTPQQFADRAMAMPGIRWVKWRSDWEAADCFGLLLLYFREVHGIDLGEVPQLDIGAGFDAAHGWSECEPQPGASAWMAFDASGAPAHCGILLDATTVLHSEGDEERGGSVRLTRLAALRRIYPDVRFMRHESMAVATC